MKRDLHIHSTFSDGKNTPEEIIKAAIDKDFDEIGFSDHSYIEAEKGYCLDRGKTEEYISEIFNLKEKYNNKISVLCGIEQDFYSPFPADKRFDYIIGSVHYVKINEDLIAVDISPEILTDAAKKYFNGDMLKLAQLYYDTVSRVVLKTNADIIGHFDLISKFNEKYNLFDESSPRYISAWKKAADVLLQTAKPFEINTGAISRGYRTAPYPSLEIKKYIANRGGKFILSSDSHSVNSLFSDEEYFHFSDNDTKN